MYSLVCKGWRQHEFKNKMDGEPNFIAVLYVLKMSHFNIMLTLPLFQFTGGTGVFQVSCLVVTLAVLILKVFTLTPSRKLILFSES